MKKKLKSIYQYVIVFLLGGFILGGIGVYATSLLSSSEVSYDNSESGGNSNNVQKAIEELYSKAESCKPCGSSAWEANNKYFSDAYLYNSSTCITGEEKTCLRTDCYISSDKVCPVGTIIDYVVSGNSIKVRFHVLHDDGEMMTMQAQKTTVYPNVWYEGGDNNTKGPTAILALLENETSSWSNVNNQTYTMGTTVFKTNAYTGCTYNSCTKNTYTLASRTAKARMITIQETAALGCTTTAKSCPVWMNNYLNNSISYGGTENDYEAGTGYWTMSAYSANSTYAWRVGGYGYMSSNPTSTTVNGARAVVVVSK